MYKLIETLTRIFYPEKYWKQKTRERFHDLCPKIIEIVGKESPYIIGGKWSWLITSENPNPLSLDIVFPSAGLSTGEEEAFLFPVAIVVWPPFLGTWDVCRKYCGRASWELYNQAASTLRLRSELAGWGVVEINYWDPVDVESLTLAIKEKTIGATH